MKTLSKVFSIRNIFAAVLLFLCAPALNAAASVNMGQCLVSSQTWANSSYTAQTGTFNLYFNASPCVNNEDQVIGLSNTPASTYSGLAAIVRFNSNGNIDIMNLNGYSAAVTYHYTAGTTYHFQMAVNMAKHTYSVYVSTTGAQTTLASNYAFRSPQAKITSLAYINKYSDVVGDAAVSNISLNAPADTTPPSQPAGLTATAVSTSQINLSWNASSDNVGVAGYNIYRNGTKVGSSTTTSYTDSALSASTTYSYTVAAYDAAGNVSAQSTSVSATTQTQTETLTVSAGSNGAISPSGMLTVNAGTSQTFTVTPNAGYNASLSVDGTNVSLNNNAYTLSNITANHTITASFTIQSETLTVSAASNGTISPSGNVTVNYGASQTFSLTPAAGYTASLTVDGTAVTLSNNSYTLSNITSSHAVAAGFVPVPPVNGACDTANLSQAASAPTSNLCSSGNASSVSGGAAGPWTWNCNGTNGGSNASCIAYSSVWSSTPFTAQSGSFTATVTAVPSANNEDTVVGLSSAAASAYTNMAAIVLFSNNGTIVVRNGSNYTADAAMAYTAGTAYTIKFTVNIPAGTYSVTATPAGGAAVALATNYTFRTEQAGVTSLGFLNKYSDMPGDAALSPLSVVPIIQTVTLTVYGGNNGTISPTGSVVVNYGASQTFTLTPAAGYTPSLSVDGTNVTLSNNTYTLTNVIAVHTVIANFAAQTDTLTVSVGSNGTMSPSSNVTVNYGASQTFTLAPAGGYTANLTIDGLPAVLTNNVFTLNNITSNHAVAAAFSQANNNACPQGTAYADGCSAASGGSNNAQHPTLFSAYAKRPAWNVAGVDYAVGVPAGLALKDPTAPGALPACAVFNTSKQIYVSDNCTIDGYDFSVQGGGFQLYVAGSNISVVRNYFLGGVPVNQAAGTSNIYIAYNTMDGGGANGDTSFGEIINLNGIGAVIEYNWIKNTPQHFVSLGNGGSLIYQYNLLENGALTPCTGISNCPHLNFLQWMAGPSNNPQFAFNTVVQNDWILQPGEMIQMYNNLTGSITNASVNNNVIIATLNPGQTPPNPVSSVFHLGGTPNTSGIADNNWINASGTYAGAASGWLYNGIDYPGWTYGSNMDLTSSGSQLSAPNAPLSGSAVNAACGSANGVMTPTKPIANLCAVGSLSTNGVGEYGNNGVWGWTCVGTNGGSNASCVAGV